MLARRRNPPLVRRDLSPSPAQKRAILYDNAARFLRLSDETIARHRETPGAG